MSINAREDEQGAWQTIQHLMKRERRSIASFGDRNEKREICLARFSSRPNRAMIPARYQEYELDENEYSRRPHDHAEYHCCCTKPINEWTYVTNVRNGNVLRLGLDCKPLFRRERGDFDEEDSFVVSDGEIEEAVGEENSEEEEEESEHSNHAAAKENSSEEEAEDSEESSHSEEEDSSEGGSEEEVEDVEADNIPKTRAASKLVHKQPAKKTIERIDLTNDEIVVITKHSVEKKRKDPFEFDVHPVKRVRRM